MKPPGHPVASGAIERQTLSQARRIASKCVSGARPPGTVATAGSAIRQEPVDTRPRISIATSPSTPTSSVPCNLAHELVEVRSSIGGQALKASMPSCRHARLTLIVSSPSQPARLTYINYRDADRHLPAWFPCPLGGDSSFWEAPQRIRSCGRSSSSKAASGRLIQLRWRPITLWQ